MRINSILGVVYLVIGIIVASTHDYFKNIDTVKRVLSALLAVILWPLILFGVNLHIH
jgi:hypothetical protein